MFEFSRLIRVFISSTFRDLTEERTYLVNKVFPVLRNMASQRNVTVVPVDLRWGITSEQDEKMTYSAKVVSQCLHEVDNSHPFFIGITGQRYGWCPRTEELGGIDVPQSSQKWISTCLDGEMSVTELEMQYAVWRNPQPAYAGFYIKDCKAEPDSHVALERLKNTIRREADHHGYEVHDFHTPEELGQFLTDDFKRLLDLLFPEEGNNPLQRMRAAQRAFLASRRRWYVPIDDSFAQLDAFLYGENNIMAVVGDSGLGKSSLMANWLSKVIDERKTKTVYHFVSINQNRSHYQTVVDHLIADICDIYQLPTPITNEDEDTTTPDSAATSLYNLCFSIPPDKPLLIVIDGLNQVSDGEDSYLLRWLPYTFPSQVHILLTSTPERDIIRTLEKRGCSFIHLKHLYKRQQRELAEKYLIAHGKRLEQKFLNKIVAHKCNSNTLILRSLLDELICFGDFEHLEDRIDYFLASENAEDFFQRVLTRIEKEFHTLPVNRILALIAFSQRGMGETELQDIVGGIRPIDWSQFYSVVSNITIIQSGLIGFSHQMLHNAAIIRYGDLEQETRESIIDFFKDTHQSRAYDELAHQYFTLRQLPNLYNLLRRFPVFEHLYTSGEHLLYTYWFLLEHEYENSNWDTDEYKGFYSFLGLYPWTEKQAHIFHHLGMFYDKYFNYDVFDQYDLLSIDFFNRAYEIMLKKVGKDNIDIGHISLSLGLKLMHVEKYDEATHYIHDGFNNLQKLLGEESPILADYYWQYGLALLKRENIRMRSQAYTNDNKPYDVSRAMGFFELASIIYKYFYGNDNLAYGNVLRSMGIAYFNVKEYRKAIDLVKQSLAIQQRYLSDNDMQLGRTYRLLGIIHSRTQYPEHDIINRKKLEEKDVDLAYDYYQKAKQILIESLGSRHQLIIELNVNIFNDVILFFLNEGENFLYFMEEALRKDKHELAVEYAKWSLHFYMKYCKLDCKSPRKIKNVQKLKKFLSESN